MSDRVCIHSNGTVHFHFSAEDLVSCCTSCGFGCSGGFPGAAWQYWVKKGIVSGGSYHSNQVIQLASCFLMFLSKLHICLIIIRCSSSSCGSTVLVKTLAASYRRFRNLMKTLCRTFGWVIGSSQRPLPTQDNTPQKHKDKHPCL
jgi:hypothetical protein